MEENVEERLTKYLKLTEKAVKKAKIAIPKSGSMYSQAEDFLSMATNYLADAKHFKQSKQPVTALASVSYAHAWLDAGARLGLLDVKMDEKLFTLGR